MVVPLSGALNNALARGGRVLILGASDTGKTTLAVRCAREAGGWLLDADVGQSEIGPPGLLDIAEADSAKDWRFRGTWFHGSATPFPNVAELVTGASRLAEKAEGAGARTLVMDTPSFINTISGHSLFRCLIGALQPSAVVAIQRRGEMERFLAGLSSRIVRLEMDAAVRVKPPALRAARRASKLGEYLKDAPIHTVSLTEKTMWGTRLGFGTPLSTVDHRVASPLLGCPVLHAERGPSSVAFWTLGQPRHTLDRVAAEFGVGTVATFDGAYWNGRCLGFIGSDGFCLTMGIVDKVDWPSLTATVKAPAYSVAEAVSIYAGLMRARIDGSVLPPVPDREA